MSTPTSTISSLGVNVAGFLRGGLGLGQAARLYVASLNAAGIPVTTTTLDPRMPEVPGAIAKSAEFTDQRAADEPSFNLVCVNAPELPSFYEEVGREFFEARYTIGVWAWETDVVPASWDRAFALVDEIWVYSSYVVELLSHAAPVPIVRMPLPIVPPDPTGAELTIDVPDAFTFLFIFDFFSTLQRKNPLGLVEAFKRAFEPGEGPHLLLKSFNGDFKPERLARLIRAADGRRDIHIVDRYVSEAERAALMARCDAYVSLHRAEGFGLTLGEAMALGKPVIGTGFSSNLDFMTPANSYLVDYEMTDVGPQGENYPAEGRWAEPDLDHAARLMREVWEQPEAARARGARARADIAEGFSLDAVGALARARLRRLRRVGRRVGAPAASALPAAAGGTDANGLPNLGWLERAQLKLTYDPLRDAAERGGPVGMARRTALQAMRPYTYHQDEFNELVVNALRDLTQRVDEVIVDSQADVQRVERRIEALQRSGELSGPDLKRVVEGARARPGSTHPAISFLDEHGRRSLGFRDAAAADDAEGYRGFEDIFRGAESEVRRNQGAYLDLFEGAEWVLDIGCGRGEFLDALREKGIEGRGVDLDPTMVERCVEKGHDVKLADATSYLAEAADGSVPGVFAAQVIEHLSSAELNELLALLHRKIAPGGVLVMETVNPHNPAALKAFWTDTTHHHPLFPEVTLALCRLHGFDSGQVVFPHATSNFDEDVYANRDYAVVARNPAAT